VTSPSALAEQQANSTSDWTIRSDFGGSYTVEMSLAAWIAVPEHPRRRDTERQAKKEHWEAARVAAGPVLEALRWVVAAELDGQHYKVDGHARAVLWASGRLKAPSCVIAQVFRCRSREELNALYATFDTQLAAESLIDRVTGAYCEHGLTLTSQRLRAGWIADALSIAYRGVSRSTERYVSDADIDIYAAVGFFAKELQLLDSLNPQTDLFPTGVLAAALLSIAEEPQALDFFRRLSERQGSKKDGLPDPVEAVLEELRTLKSRKGGRVRSVHEDLCARTLVAVRTWRQGPEVPQYWGKVPLQTNLLPETIRLVRSVRGVVSSSV